MSLVDRVKKSNREVPQKKTEELPKTKKVEQPVKQVSPETSFDLTKDELEFLIRLIGDANFKGNNLMFIYDLVKKLQEQYVIKSGGN
tara:strand:+ start:182 stop:442 length:261 start_codon:yes stop_codon:yes gene_type:complete